MSSLGNGQPSSFRQVISTAVKQQIIEAAAAAQGAGLGPAFHAAMKIVDQRLSNDPRNFGELKQTLEYARLTVQVAVVRPVVVEFGIHEDQPYVFLRRVTFLAPG